MFCLGIFLKVPLGVGKEPALVKNYGGASRRRPREHHLCRLGAVYRNTFCRVIIFIDSIIRVHVIARGFYVERDFVVAEVGIGIVYVGRGDGYQPCGGVHREHHYLVVRADDFDDYVKLLGCAKIAAIAHDFNHISAGVLHGVTVSRVGTECKRYNAAACNLISLPVIKIADGDNAVAVGIEVFVIRIIGRYLLIF